MASATNYCVAVTHTGSHGGSSWNDAMDIVDMSATTFSNGDTIIIAGGDYRGKGAPTFKTTSGSSTTTYRHAVSTLDDGNGLCGAGNTATAPAGAYTAQVQLDGGGFVLSSHITIDGRSRPSDWWHGNETGYGIVIDNSGGVGHHGGAGHGIDLGTSSAAVSYVNFNKVMIKGSTTRGDVLDDDVYSYDSCSGGCVYDNISFTNSALVDAGRCAILIRGDWTNFAMTLSYVARNHSAAGPYHGEPISAVQVESFVIKNSVFVDTEGSATMLALISGPTGGGAVSVSHDINVYNNAIIYTIGYRTGTNSGGGGGAIAVVYDTNQHNCAYNVEFVHNTTFNQDFFVASYGGLVASTDGTGTAGGVFCADVQSAANRNWHSINNLYWNSSRVTNVGDSTLESDGYLGRGYNLLADTLDDPYYDPNGLRGAPSHDKYCYHDSSVWGGWNAYGIGTPHAMDCSDFGGTYPSDPFKDSTSNYPDLHLTYEIMNGANLSTIFAGYGSDADNVSRTSGHYNVGAYQCTPANGC
jgi:hypothetical protein